MTCLNFLRTRFRVLVDQGKARQLNLTGGVPGKLLLDSSTQGVVADELCKEMAETLERLIQLPDWWRLSNRYMLGLLLQSYDAGASPRMRAVLFRMRESLLVEWRKNPSFAAGSDWKSLEESNDLYGLGTIWFLCEQAIENGRIAALPSLTPSPGRVWPPWDMVLFAFDLMTRSGDWEGALSFLGKLPLDYPEPPVSSERWDEYLLLRSMVASHQVLAYARLGQWDQARLAALEARRWAGLGWKENSLRQEFIESPSEGSEAKDPALRATQRLRIVAPKDLLEILSSDPEPKIPAPLTSAPIRVVLRGTPAWQQEWVNLRHTQALAPWGPEELRWEPASKVDESVMDRLPQKPVWAAVKDGTTVLAAGDVLLDPRFLALQLAGGGQTKLQRLNQFIRKNPEHMDARRDRFALLLTRMPNPALEPFLAEDAATALIPPLFKPSDTWILNASLWQAWAQKRMPELEAALRRWPRSPKLWKAWIAWAAFHPAFPSAHRLALSIDVLGARSSWIAGLPKEMHMAVAEELRRKSQFETMRIWFQEAWDGMNGNAESSFPEVEAARKETIYQHLSEALTALQRKEALAELIRQHKAMITKSE